MSSSPRVDVRDIDELSAALLQVLFFVEHTNCLASDLVRRNYHSLVPRGRTQVETMRELLERSEQSLRKPAASWASSSAWITLSRRIGIEPGIDPDFISNFLSSMLVHPKVGSPPRVPRPHRLSHNIFLYRRNGERGFATRRILPQEHLLRGESVSLLYWDEALNPISALQAFLMDVLGEDTYAAEHYIQTWIKHSFDLPYTPDVKYAASAVSGRMNEFFYGSPNPSQLEFHAGKSTTIEVTLLLHEIALMLEPAPQGLERPASGGPAPQSWRRALGLYLFLRFCHQLRGRHYWLDAERADLEGADESRREFLAAMAHGQCVSALRPLQGTFFQTRIFGALSRIPGLNDVFRGGLLPRTESGRTFLVWGGPGAGKTVFALQMMSDVARHGHIAIYFSFEESYDSIVDRLATFGLFDAEKFQILPAGRDLESRLAEASPNKGVLVLYSEAGTKQENLPAAYPHSLPSVIDSIARSLYGRARWRWRALAIDSINALEFRSKAQDPEGRRLDLYHLVRSIEDNRFFGVILNERGSEQFEILSYLADTVVELGTDSATRARWFEVKKCRSQFYHPGTHPFRIADGKGLKIYPSLTARMSTLRRRLRTTLSERRVIPFPASWKQELGLPGLQEKSSTLIWGPSGTGKTALLLHLATEPILVKEERAAMHLEQPPANLLLVTFRTSELNVMQSIQNHRGVQRRWAQVWRSRLRRYSPGSDLTAEQILTEIWSYIQQSQREGLAVERILFDEIEVAGEFFPALKQESLFWPTLLELIATEAITAFFVSGSGNQGQRLGEFLGATMDYILRTSKDSDDQRHWLEIEKGPALWGSGRARRVELRIDSETGSIEGFNEKPRYPNQHTQRSYDPEEDMPAAGDPLNRS